MLLVFLTALSQQVLEVWVIDGAGQSNARAERNLLGTVTHPLAMLQDKKLLSGRTNHTPREGVLPLRTHSHTQ